MNKRGFTLIEIIVAIAIMVILGVIITEIFIRSLQGGEKSKMISTIKQNGQASLDLMDKTVRNSDNVICPTGSNPSDTIAVSKNGIYTRFRIKTVLSDLHILQDNPILGANQVQFLSDICNYSIEFVPPASPITNTNQRTGVRVESGSFTRQKAIGYKDIIIIQFKLIPSLNAGSIITSSIDAIEFKTSVGLR